MSSPRDLDRRHRGRKRHRQGAQRRGEKYYPNRAMARRFVRQGLRRSLSETTVHEGPPGYRRKTRAQLAAPKWRGVYT